MPVAEPTLPRRLLTYDSITLEQNPDAFRGKIVLIGATSIALQDIYPAPFSATQATPAWEIVANTMNTILNGKFMNYAPPLVGAAAIFFCSGYCMPSPK